MLGWKRGQVTISPSPTLRTLNTTPHATDVSDNGSDHWRTVFTPIEVSTKIRMKISSFVAEIIGCLDRPHTKASVPHQIRLTHTAHRTISFAFEPVAREPCLRGYRVTNLRTSLLWPYNWDAPPPSTSWINCFRRSISIIQWCSTITSNHGIVPHCGVTSFSGY
ncbi:hypothetical protein K491DRAFT_281837 [Lophiostoma macrostomum CBS 122681]|uniref:Uncharacterized protein n=1 Tax=Lophiostoma macrostomum CBS 122681 TaxID=1314788 RepID=A0A6A6TT86_9PLEO|nr:hypothetical protein K491DRAFT_281837 [Lophiostoma macrostomum CBS 122681]